MLVKLGQNGVKSIEDLAGCASDDLIGWSERTEAGEKKFVGYLSEFGLSREQVDAMIMAARVRAGWVDEAAAATPDEGDAGEAADEAPAN
jgi:N utilization substance protein A